MPKVKLTDFEQKRLIARVVIKKRMELKRIDMPTIAKRLNRPTSTMYHRCKSPETFRLEDLWALVSFLGLSDQEILQIVRGKEQV